MSAWFNNLFVVCFSLFFFSLFLIGNSIISVTGISKSVAIQKRLMMDYLIDNCTLNLTSSNNQSSLITLPSAISAISTPSSTQAINIYSCLNKCGRSYDSLSSLQQHMRLECSPQSEAIPIIKKFDCLYCTESFTRRNKLKLHIDDKHHTMIE